MGLEEDPDKIRARLDKDVDMWMKHHLDGSTHQALTTDDAENDAEGRLDEAVKVKIYADAEDQKKRFLDAIHAQAKENNTSIELDLDQQHTWEDVSQILQQNLDGDEGKIPEKPKKEEQNPKKEHGHGSALLRKMRRPRASADSTVSTECGDAGRSLGQKLQDAARRGYESFGKNSATFQSWLELLPTESNYLSVLCGGLKLILRAAHRLSEIRSKIHEFVENIPRTISGTAIVLGAFKNSPELHKSTAELYVAILKPLQAVYEWCQKGLWGRITIAHLRQELYAKDMTDMINSVKDCCIRFREKAQDCSYVDQRVMKTMIHTSSRNNDRGFNTVTTGVTLTNRQLQLMRQEDLDARKVEAARFQQQTQELRALNRENKQVLNQIKNFLASNPRPFKQLIAQKPHLQPQDLTANSSIISRARSVEPTTRYTNATDTQIERLHRALDVDPDVNVAAEDVLDLLRLGGTLSLPSQDRSVALMQSPRLQNWVTCPTSSVLLVNGHMFSSTSETRQSPLSFVCAKLVDVLLPKRGAKLANRNSILAVNWFCGQHTDYGIDPDAHPTGMMNNLISQLLTQLSSRTRNGFELNLTPITALRKLAHVGRPAPEGAFDSSSIKELCQLFAELVFLLPEGTNLFCIIDGISYYEDEEYTEELHEAISMFMKLATQIRGGCVLKLLVTSPLRSHEAQKLFYDNEIYDMDPKLPPNGGFTAMKWKTSLGQGAERVSRIRT
ncbi:hypothetical protein MMC17_005948 [Xylographa soralifera]|nr:hypothetical protein [Xylographa soralifera]